MHWGKQKCMLSFIWEAQKKEITKNTDAQIEK